MIAMSASTEYKASKIALLHFFWPMMPHIHVFLLPVREGKKTNQLFTEFLQV